MLLLLLAVAGCKQVPDGVLGNEGKAGQNGVSFDAVAMAEDAVAAFDVTPRTLERMRISAAMFAQAFEKQEARTYRFLWQAARTTAWLAEYSSDNVERERYAREGLTYSNTALQAEPEAPEAIFYNAVLAGFLGELDNAYGLDAVKRIEEGMTKLIEREVNIANGGPWRALGVLQLRAPGPPVSVGSLRNGKRNLERALELAPEWPENHLYLAEAEFMWASDRDGREDIKLQAQERLKKWLTGSDAKPPAGFETEFEHWRELAKKLEAAN